MIFTSNYYKKTCGKYTAKLRSGLKNLYIWKCTGYDWGVNVDEDGYSWLNQVDIDGVRVPASQKIDLGLVYGGVNIVRGNIQGDIEYIVAADDADEMVIGFDDCIVSDSAKIMVYSSFDDATPTITMPLREYIQKSINDLGFVKKLLGEKL